MTDFWYLKIVEGLIFVFLSYSCTTVQSNKRDDLGLEGHLVFIPNCICN